MARQEKPEDPGPSKLYLLSFGDTMTTLLAFFIILCSMADDQSGANLYSGTGSFVNAFDGAGGAGKFSTATSNRAVELDHASPVIPCLAKTASREIRRPVRTKITACGQSIARRKKCSVS